MDREEDLIHQHVLYFLRQNQRTASLHTVQRLSRGFYDIDGHQVDVEWQHHQELGQPGHLVVVDGPLRQPFADYLERSEANAEYDTHTIAKTSALHHVPKERRMTFDDTHKKYSRLEAMKVAKEQANIREKAADYTKEGRQVPDDLVRKYNKALRQKLRGHRIGDSAREAPAPPVEAQPPPEPVDPRTLQVSDDVIRKSNKAGVACWMAHRGISLNGMPTFVPAPMQAVAGTPVPMPQIKRSFSGTNLPLAGSAGIAGLRIPPIPGMAMQSIQAGAVAPGVAYPALAVGRAAVAAAMVQAPKVTCGRLR